MGRGELSFVKVEREELKIQGRENYGDQVVVWGVVEKWLKENGYED